MCKTCGRKLLRRFCRVSRALVAGKRSGKWYLMCFRTLRTVTRYFFSISPCCLLCLSRFSSFLWFVCAIMSILLYFECHVVLNCCRTFMVHHSLPGHLFLFLHVYHPRLLHAYGFYSQPLFCLSPAKWPQKHKFNVHVVNIYVYVNILNNAKHCFL